MKKILCAAAALSLIGSAAFADITISGRGYVETQVFNYTKGEGTSLFSNWDTDDSDVFISGDIGGKAGAMLNIDFKNAKNSGNLAVGDWNVWIKPLDFLTIKASNEANRVANRYNSIIDKTESKWGILQGTYNDGASDDDSFKGYQVNMDFGVVKVDLGFNSGLYDNVFVADSMRFGYTGEIDVSKEATDVVAVLGFEEYSVNATASGKNDIIGAGARVVVPVEGLLNLDAFFKIKYENNADSKINSIAVLDKDGKTVENIPDAVLDIKKISFSRKVFSGKFGVIADIVALDNMGLAIGYIGDFTNTSVGVAEESIDSNTFMNAVDVRFQYNMDKMGFALHNNATFGEEKFYDKLNLGFMYGLTDAATLFVEVQNWMDATNSDALKDIVTVYPRFAFGIAEGVTLKTGLRADFGVTEYDDTMAIALPLSMEVIF